MMICMGRCFERWTAKLLLLRKRDQLNQLIVARIAKLPTVEQQARLHILVHHAWRYQPLRVWSMEGMEAMNKKFKRVKHTR